MYKHILENAGDISLMALVPLVLFTLIFVGAMIWAITRNGKHVEHMSHLPLEDTDSNFAETE